jgi:transposase
MAGQGVSRMLVFKPHSGETTMTNRQPIPMDPLLVAIDIAKVRNEVLIEAPNHKRRRRLSVLNTRAEHDRLIETLRAYGKPVICAFEATGNYHRPIAWRLIEAGFDVRLVSSMALARTREALHNGWDKNDPRDAQVILHSNRCADATGGGCSVTMPG